MYCLATDRAHAHFYTYICDCKHFLDKFCSSSFHFTFSILETCFWTSSVQASAPLLRCSVPSAFHLISVLHLHNIDFQCGSARTGMEEAPLFVAVKTVKSLFQI